MITPKKWTKYRKQVLISAKDSPLTQAGLKDKCKNDIEFFFNVFLWIAEPRDRKIIPFLLWPHEVKLLNDLESSLTSKKDLLVEKSRDMGATWMGLAWILYHWLFDTGFQALIGSRKLDLVDKKDDPSTLFERLRFMVRKLPAWLLPEGFNWREDSSFLRLTNRVNNSVITGESANADFGRQARATVVWLDEFAFWEQDESSWQAVSQVSQVKIVVSTVKGKQNTFARLRWKSDINLCVLDWREHPDKTQEWHDNLTKDGIMTLQQVASEVDRDYQASAGRPYYQEFDNKFILDSYEVNPDMKIIRAWDFGYHHPVCSFWQKNDLEHGVQFYEVMGNDLSLLDFMLIIKYVSGEPLGQEKIDRVASLCENNKVENVLNIAHLEKFNAVNYDDYCDTAGSQKSDKSNQTSIEILNSGGIFPSYKLSRIDEGANAFRKLMLKDMFRVTKSCPITIEGFQGGYHYSENKPDEADKDNYFDHLMDANRYLVLFEWDYLVDSKVVTPEDKYQKMRDNGLPYQFVEGIREINQRTEYNSDKGRTGYG